MSAEKLITEHIDLWTSSVKAKKTQGRGSSKKRELYGIKKLRELILELAVRGKLVPQDSNDEPASVLLKRIAAEKEQLIRGKKLKPQKKASHYVTPIEFKSVPDGWATADFGDITFNRDAERIPLSVSDRNTRQGQYDYYGASGVIDSIDDYLFDKPLLLIGEDGANLVNRSKPIAFMAYGKYWVNNHAHVIDGISEFFLIYLGLYINSISLIPYITGMAQPKMNQAKMNSILVALPPVDEQNRIIAKVDELMALCDQLEQQTEASLEAHKLLVDTLLATLTDALDANELSDNWARLAEHFDTLITTDYAVEQLKQTILQLAVQGKLVLQDYNDEPASELLKKISIEKEQLVKDGVIKNLKALSPISKDEEPYNLPSSWVCVRFGEVAVIERGGSPRPIKSFITDDPDGLNWIKIGDTDQGGKYITSTQEKIRKEGLVKTRMVYPGDFLLTNSMSFGRPYITKIQGCIHDGWLRISPQSIIDKDFLYLLLSSPYIFKAFQASAAGAVVMNLNAEKVREVVILVPPLAEQSRIVAKVEELRALYDQLKVEINKASHSLSQLTDVLVSKVTGNEIQEIEKMKVPDNELVSKLKLKVSPADKELAPLSAILSNNKGELSAKRLWQLSKMEIDVFYQQLKVEMEPGWIVEPEKALMKEKV